MRYGIIMAAAGFLLAGACAHIAAESSETKQQQNEPSLPTGPVVVQFQETYVYCDDKTKNHFAPTGWMGDASDIKLGSLYMDDNPALGKTCLKITYLCRGKKEWAGIYWQNPANNWGSIDGGYNLTGAQCVTFWARGSNGGETVSEFKIGGLTGKYPDSDTAWVGPVKLKKEWQQYKIDLKGKDLRYISGGFCLILLKSDNPKGCSLYLANIKYE